MTTFRLHVEIQEHWRLFLEIPASEVNLLTLSPLKWLRFMGREIYGADGWLASTPGGDEVAEDDEIMEDYYYVSNFQAGFIDINALDDRTSNASQQSVRTAYFRRDIVARDGRCIITGALPRNSRACHILPHSKGDDYISAISDLRAGDEAPVTEIGDIRNGILLYKGLHDVFGAGEIAFMLTPNRYLLPEDIPSRGPLTAPPPTRKLTLQNICPLHPPDSEFARHNLDLALFRTDSQPSAFLLDFFYASAIMQRWGKSQTSLLAKDIQDVYYACDTPSVSGDETEIRTLTGPAGSSRHHSTPLSENRSLSDVMDELLFLHLRSPSKGPSDLPNVSAKVMSWLKDAATPT
ncbi:hypothetical protein C8F01DRAFT_1123166 [Mycena amicta]|nr:hypothetical protein C8F01DRAFT_1123166 [Mycena amicta]